MTDAELDGWGFLLVGHQWPTSTSLGTVSAAAASRGTVATAFENYAQLLQSIRSGPLADQRGVTAEDALEAFQHGRDRALDVSEKNVSKRTAYEGALQSANELRSALSSIAQEGKSQIRNIETSNDPLPVKVSKIVDVVVNAQSDADTRAATHSDNVFNSIQQVLNKSGFDTPARQFSAQHGFDLSPSRQPLSKDAVQEQVSNLLKQSPLSPDASGSDMLSNDSNSFSQSAGAGKSEGQVPFTDSGVNVATPVSSPAQAGGSTSGGGAPSPGTPDLPLQTALQGGRGPISIGAANQPPTSGVSGSAAPVTGVTTPTGNTSFISQGVSQSSNPISAGSLSSAPTTALSPEGFAQNFNSGAQTGNPMSAGAEGLTSSAAHAMQPQAPIHPESMTAPPAYTTPSSGAPLFETAHPATNFDAAPAPAAAPDTTQTYMAAPAGPLPAYGADLRPAAASAPAAPMPSAAAPASAPVHPSSGGQLGQPAVVRQTPTASATAQPPNAITESALASTATGAMAGASAAQTQAQQRLQRLLDAVARQEPKLRWAIGDREDGTTVLTTDLASGWIPPHVEIPTGIKLLAPRLRSRTLEALLGETALTVAHTPGQYLPPAEEAEPTQTSIRARDTQEVEELGWELSQATKWRDGLPRLAHTLAKAALTGTGYLDNEVELLREHLTRVAHQVLTDYPDHVDTAKVGDWQLLATIDALIKDEKTAANYHFAWFQTLNLALKGEVHR